jgi:hypothetical protein
VQTVRVQTPCQNLAQAQHSTAQHGWEAKYAQSTAGQTILHQHQQAEGYLKKY